MKQDPETAALLPNMTYAISLARQKIYANKNEKIRITIEELEIIKPTPTIKRQKNNIRKYFNCITMLKSSRCKYLLIQYEPWIL